MSNPPPKTILVVDDTPASLRLLSDICASQGYRVRPVASGEEALASCQKELPDIILLDINMPDLDGYEVCRRLKADPHTYAVPVIFISALSRAFEKVTGFEVGGVDYITKPFQFEEVLARVKTHLHLQELRQQLQTQNLQLQEKNATLDTLNGQLRNMNAALEQLFGMLAQSHGLLQAERDKSERLLLNILPEPIAQRLKQHEARSLADHFPEVTVLFADLVDFTRLSGQLSPDALVAMLDGIFSTFDELAEKHNLEKIKTIGDAYMVVSGLPTPRPDHLEAMAEMALEMRAWFDELANLPHAALAVRIGMHVGPVVAGVIGRNKFSYDLWGDTVNLASRMESYGVAGEIQVSAEVQTRLQDRYHFTPRGPIAIKGIGALPTFLLTGRKP